MTHDEVEQFIEEDRLLIVAEVVEYYNKAHELNDDDVWTFYARDERMIDVNIHRPEGANHIAIWGYRLNECDIEGNTIDTSIDHFVARLEIKE